MPLPQLDNLVRTGQLKAEPVAQAELDGLLRSGAARIADAENAQLSIESRENRYLVFQSLQVTLTLPAQKWRVLDQAHKKRNLTEYEGATDVDEKLVEAMIRIAREVPAAVLARGPVSP